MHHVLGFVVLGIATRNPDQRGQWPEEQTPRRAWCTLRDGAFRVAVAPGPQGLAILDLAANVRLWQSQEPVLVTPGGEHEVVAEFDAVCLDLSLRGPDPQPLASDWLQIRTGKGAEPDPGGSSSRAATGWLLSQPGVDLLGAAETERLLVPTGPVRLVADAGFGVLQRGLKSATGVRVVVDQYLDVAARPATQALRVAARAPFPLQVR